MDPKFLKLFSKKSYFAHLLLELKQKKQSLISHSAIFDHMNHGIFLSSNPHDTRYLDTLADRIAHDMNSLKEWIDKNPEYLLIISSGNNH